MARRNQLSDIFSKYDMTGGLNDGKIHLELCWPWKGALNGKGIPYFSYDGKSYVAHRVAYHVFHPDTFTLDDKRLIRHVKCDNNICGNHAHMAPGTHQDNMNDAVEHSRFGLEKAIVDDIIRMNEEFPDMTHIRIAGRMMHKYGRNVARTTVTDILSNRRNQRRKES